MLDIETPVSTHQSPNDVDLSNCISMYGLQQ